MRTHKETEKALAESIRSMETEGATIVECGARFPETAADLRDSMAIWEALGTAPRYEPAPGAQSHGLERLLTALSEPADAGRRAGRLALAPAAARIAIVGAAAVAILGTIGGASAALGGPDVFDEVLSGLDGSNASDTGKEHANPNAFEGSDNAGQGIENASDTGKEHANPNAFEGSSNAGQGIENAGDAANENAGPNASAGSGNAGQGLDNRAEGAGSQGRR